jgi:excisionase family DNA binding protein
MLKALRSQTEQSTRTMNDMELNARPRTLVQVAAELNLSQRTIRGWIAQRRIGVVRLGRAVRVSSAEIQRLLDGGYVSAEPREL